MLCDYTAGWVSGVFSLLIGHPFDTIKIQQQIRGISFTEAAKRIKAHRGWPGFYRGLLVPLLTTGALNALFFGLYGDFRDYLVLARMSKGPDPSKSDIEYDATYMEMFVAGSLAGTACIGVAAPIELVKTKLQSQMKRKMFTGPFDCFFTVVREAGIRGIYRGIVPMSIRDGFPGGGLYYVVYEQIKRNFNVGNTDNYTNKEIIILALAGGTAGSNAVGTTINFSVICEVLDLCHPGVFPSSSKAVFISHSTAGFCSWVVCLPFDVVKSRMQADHHTRPHYRGMVHCAKEIYRCDGIIGLYRGFWSCAARSVPVNASIFLVYEYIQQKFCKKLTPRPPPPLN